MPALDCGLVNCPLNRIPSFSHVGEDMWACNSAMLEKLSAFSTCQQVHLGCNRLFLFFFKREISGIFFRNLTFFPSGLLRRLLNLRVLTLECLSGELHSNFNIKMMTVDIY